MNALINGSCMHNQTKGKTANAEKKTALLQDGTMNRNEKILSIVCMIKNGKTADARNLLKELISFDMENPEAYNLLGISYETDGNFVRAAKFYRVAYYMDQTFKAAADNMERVCSFRYTDKNVSW